MTEDELIDKVIMRISETVDIENTAHLIVADLKAAGWSPPVPSRLRVVTTTTFENNKQVDQTTRPLTPAEYVEVAEKAHVSWPGRFISLDSGAMVAWESNDEP